LGRPSPPLADASTRPAPFPGVGNLLCLDLVNTEIVSHGVRVDLLRRFSDLVEWARSKDVLTDAAARRAMAQWNGSRQAAASFEAALALRQALRALAEALAHRRSGPDAAVPAINEALAFGASVLRLERHAGAYVTSRHLVAPSAASLLAPVAESAAWLLARGDLTLVRRCENPACILYFYDTTKNKRRRWCSMDACGSRAKAAAYYRRTRASKAGTRRMGAEDRRPKTEDRRPKTDDRPRPTVPRRSAVDR